MNDGILSLERRIVALVGFYDHAFVEKVKGLALKEANDRWLCLKKTTCRCRGGQQTFFPGTSLGGHEWHGVELRFEGRLQGATDLGALDLEADHVLAQVPFAPKEGFMVVSSLVSASSETGEAIEVKLALETGKLGLVEVEGHDRLDELGGIVYDEAATVRLPGDNVAVSVLFNGLEHVVKLPGKGSDDASSRDSLLFTFVAIACCIACCIACSGGKTDKRRDSINHLGILLWTCRCLVTAEKRSVLESVVAVHCH